MKLIRSDQIPVLVPASSTDVSNELGLRDTSTATSMHALITIYIYERRAPNKETHSVSNKIKFLCE